jgi:hypothetical protein
MSKRSAILVLSAIAAAALVSTSASAMQHSFANHRVMNVGSAGAGTGKIALHNPGTLALHSPGNVGPVINQGNLGKGPQGQIGFLKHTFRSIARP